MMENKEILANVKKRAEVLNKEKNRKKARIIRVTSLAASFLIILCISTIIPTLMNNVAVHPQTNHIYMGTIFSNSSILGYIVMGVLSFFLGVIVTLICYKIKQKNEEESL